MSDDKHTITQSEYWREIKACAKAVKKSVKDEGAEESDAVHELVDGHSWIIYTWAYPYVLIHSRNEDAMFDSMGATEASSYQQIMQQMAFYAMEQDIFDELHGR